MAATEGHIGEAGVGGVLGEFYFWVEGDAGHGPALDAADSLEVLQVDGELAEVEAEGGGEPVLEADLLALLLPLPHPPQQAVRVHLHMLMIPLELLQCAVALLDLEKVPFDLAQAHHLPVKIMLACGGVVDEDGILLVLDEVELPRGHAQMSLTLEGVYHSLDLIPHGCQFLRAQLAPLLLLKALEGSPTFDLLPYDLVGLKREGSHVLLDVVVEIAVLDEEPIGLFGNIGLQVALKVDRHVHLLAIGQVAAPQPQNAFQVLGVIPMPHRLLHR